MTMSQLTILPSHLLHIHLYNYMVKLAPLRYRPIRIALLILVKDIAKFCNILLSY